MCRLVWLCALFVLVGSTTLGLNAQDTEPGANALEIFNQRILPIFKADEPSSCVQCHLSAVDLKNYILPSPEKTFVSLRDQGLIDLDQPAKSKILTLIQMGERDPDEQARLIHDKLRKAEYEAFSAWIAACATDPKIRSLPKLDANELARPPKADAVIRHARKSRVVDSFVRNVWSQRMRCFPCHAEHEIDPNNPRHQAALKTMAQYRENYDEDLLQRMKIFRKTPEATLRYLVQTSQEAVAAGKRPLINLDDPRNSLLVLKPMSKVPPKDAAGKLPVPPETGPIYHLGGLKLHADDQSYKSFVAWIQDYSKVVGDHYASVDDLPADNWFASQQVLRMTNVPEGIAKGTPIQLFLYGWDEKTSSWTKEPVAFTQGTVTPRKIVNGALFLLGSGSGERPHAEHAVLPRSKYLIRVYADRDGKIAKDPTMMLGGDDLLGEVELQSARWREGFRHAKVIRGDQLTKDSGS